MPSASERTDLPTDGVVAREASAQSAYETALTSASSGLRRLAIGLGATCSLAMVADVAYEIAGRLWVTGGAAVWTGDVADYLLVWLTFLGASVAVANRNVPSIRVLLDAVPARAEKVLADVGESASLAVYLYLLYFGIELSRLEVGQYSADLGWSLIWVAAAIPAGGALMAAHKLIQIALARSLQRAGICLAVLVLGALVVTQKLTLPSGAFYVCVFGVLVFLLTIGAPVAESLFFSGIAAYNLTGGFSVSNTAVAQHIYDGLNDFTFVAVPLFLLAGAIMARTRISTALIDVVRSFVGWLPGGLGIANIGASAIFADMSGSAVADTVAIGTVVIPQMEQEGYPRDFACGLQSASGTQGILYPPSISILLYAAAANASVAYMFASLLVPALLVTVTFCVLTFLICRRRGYGQRMRFRVRHASRAVAFGLPAVLTIAIILGGLLTGLFTSTEAGAVAVIYTMLLSFAYQVRVSPQGAAAGDAAPGSALSRRAVLSATSRALSGGLRSNGQALNDGLNTVGRIMFIIAAALVFGFLIILDGGPQAIVSALSGFTSSPLALMALLMLAFVVIHTFLDVSSTILVVIPLILPVLETAHVNLGQFGVLVMLNSSIGQVLPPLGLNMFLVATISGAPVLRVARAVLPFVCVLVLNLLAVLFIPALSSGFPRLLGLPI